MKKVASVHIEIAQLAYFVCELPDEKKAEWLNSFVKALSFNKQGINEYADILIAEASNYSEKLSEARAAAARKRWNKEGMQTNANQCKSMQINAKDANLCSTEQSRADKAEQIDKYKEKYSKEYKKKVVIARPDDIDFQLWEDLKKQRSAQKAPITETALNGIRSEAIKAGLDINEAIREMIERGWRGFKADWYNNKGGGNKQLSVFEKDPHAKYAADYEEGEGW